MLKKLLKYDFKSVFKYWWIGAVSSLALAVLAGICITIFKSERDLPSIVEVSAGFIFFIALVGMAAFILLSTILVCVRFYKNLFTDEGYLTFTLPVKISQILNSKLILGIVTTIATIIVFALDMFTMLAVAFPKKIFNIEYIKYYLDIIVDIIEEIGWYLPIYAVEFIALFVLLILFSQLFLNCCITFASIITKKARIITAIGIYYVSNGIFSFIAQLLLLFSMPSLFERIGNLNENTLNIVFITALLCGIAFAVMGCLMLYTLQYWMLDRKLNLA